MTGATLAITGIGVTFDGLALLGGDKTPAVADRGQAADESLQLVAARPASDALQVQVFGLVEPGQAPPTVRVEGAAATGVPEAEPRLPLVITLRNPTDDTAVLTAAKLVVTDTLLAQQCGTGGIGGAVVSALNYDFTFPDSVPDGWTNTVRQEFEVAPRDVDALSVTMGPQSSTTPGFLWKFEIFGVAASGRQKQFAAGVWMDPYQADDAEYWRAIFGKDTPPPANAQIRACAADAGDKIRAFIGEGGIVHPGVTVLLEHYDKVARS